MSRVYGENVPAFESVRPGEMPRSLYVEALK
jgi:hypothetical protein